MPKLTKRTVEALMPEAKDYFLWDSQIAGFGVRVMPSGAKTYQAQYRKGGRTRRVSVGRHGKITVDEAALPLQGTGFVIKRCVRGCVHGVGITYSSSLVTQ